MVLNPILDLHCGMQKNCFGESSRHFFVAKFMIFPKSKYFVLYWEVKVSGRMFTSLFYHAVNEFSENPWGWVGLLLT